MKNATVGNSFLCNNIASSIGLDQQCIEALCFMKNATVGSNFLCNNIAASAVLD
jgi:hypothetical protein